MKMIPRGPIVVVGILLYMTVSVSVPLARTLRPSVGEAADALMLLGFLWPAVLLLSLQNVLPDVGPAVFLGYGAIVLMGLGIVWIFTAYFQQRFGYDRWSNGRAYLWAPWLWLVPLVILQGAVFGLALLFGLPIGE